MAEYGTSTFTGSSGAKYEFTAFSRDTKFKAVGAVYFMTRRLKRSDGGFRHAQIYVGETGDLSKRPFNRQRKVCFDKKGANCVCIFLESSKSKRLKIEAGLRSKYNPPCNRD